jgi:hypothetical protein
MMRKTKIGVIATAERLYSLSAFPQINEAQLRGLLQTRSIEILDSLFEDYLKALSLPPERQAKIVKQLERVKQEASGRLKRAIDGYVTDISQVKPKGF